MPPRSNKKPATKAFTIIEVIIVISLIAVFSVMASVNYNSARRSIEFTTVYLNITEQLREMRNFAINSKVDGSQNRVPFAYASQFKKTGGTFATTSFIDSMQTPSQVPPSQYYVYDKAAGKDSEIDAYQIPDQYNMVFRVGTGLDTLSTNLNEVIIGFQPPFGDVYISDGSDIKNGNGDQYKNVSIELKSISTGASKFVCLNTIGGSIEESQTGC